jgi:hypothetical protein
MERQKNSAAIFSLVGGILILLNILLIAMSNAPIIVSNYSESVDHVMKDSAPLWWRIALGIRGYTGGTQLAIGAIIAAIIMYCALSLYLKPRNVKPLSFLIMLFSAAALLYGGGFMIGSVLSFIGAALAYEMPMGFNETFVGKMLSSMRASPKLFQHFTKDTSVKDAAMVILFANLLSGIGNGIFTFNVDRILGAVNANVPFEVLFTGRVGIDLAIAQTPIILMGLGIFKWALLSLILFFVGVNLFGEKASLASIAATTGFAYAPIGLQLLTSFVFTSKPYLTTWSMAVFFVTNLWMIIILITGMREILHVSYMKSAATVTSCGAIYTLINFLVLTQVPVPYVIRFQIQPPEMMLLITSFFIAIPSFFMGKKSS